MIEYKRAGDNLERIYRAAIDAIDPATLTARALDAGIAEASRAYVLAVGKASIAMASVLATRLGDRLAAATVVTLPGSILRSPMILASPYANRRIRCRRKNPQPPHGGRSRCSLRRVPTTW